MQAPLLMRRHERGSREWRADAVTLRGRRECGQTRDDCEDRRAIIANIQSMLNIHSLLVSFLVSALFRTATALPGSIVCPHTLCAHTGHTLCAQHCVPTHIVCQHRAHIVCQTQKEEEGYFLGMSARIEASQAR